MKTVTLLIELTFDEDAMCEGEQGCDGKVWFHDVMLKIGKRGKYEGLSLYSEDLCEQIGDVEIVGTLETGRS